MPKPTKDREPMQMPPMRPLMAPMRPADFPPNGDEAALDAEESETQQLQDLLSNHELEGGFIELERRRPLDRGYNYLDKIPVAQFGLETIKRQYGGGDYRARIKRSNGQRFKTIEFSIDLLFKGMADQTGAPTALPPPGADLEKMASILRAGDGGGVQVQMMLAMMDSQQKQSMAMLQSFTQVMVAAMGRREGGSSHSDFTPVIIEMLKTARPDPTEGLSKLLRLSREIGGGNSGGDKPDMFDRIMEMAAPVVPMLMNAVTARRAQPAPPPGVELMAAPDAPPPAGPENPAVEIQPQNETAMMIKLMLGRLLAAAKENADVDTWAGMIENMIPEAHWPEIETALKDDANWLNSFFGNRAGEAALYRPWLEKLRAALLNPPETPAE